mgnify:CR=1 FL=1
MAKKFVRGVTGIEDIESYDKTLTNVNDILSDGQDTYVHTKKGKNESYYKLTDSLKSIESTRGTVAIKKGENGTSDTTKVDTNPQKVLEHDNLIVASGLSKQHEESEFTTTLALSDNVMDIINNTVKSLGNITDYNKQKPYDNLNTLPKNSIVTYSSKDNVENCPTIAKWGFTVITFSGTKGDSILGSVQLLFTPEGQASFRLNWGDNQWGKWKDIVKDDEENKYPLALELFENIAVIGDSFSSGELYPSSGVNDYYNVSWIQLLARKHGLKATNYSRGGLQAKTWLTSEFGLQKMTQDNPKDLYFIYLGINDNTELSQGRLQIGTVSDIGTDNDTFYGNYSKIINNVISKAPNAKIAIINVENPDYNRLYTHINTIAQHFNIPVLDLSKDTLTNSPFYKQEMKDGHPQALGYATLAGAIERLLSKSFNDDNQYWINYIPQTAQ